MPSRDQRRSWQDGDRGFLGVNVRLDPAQLPPGFGAYGENLRFTEGRAATRKGIRKMSWAAESEGYTYTPVITPYQGVVAAGTFNDPVSAISWLLVITRNPSTGVIGAYRSKPGVTGAPLPVPSGATVPERVRLIQTYDGVILLRGKEAYPLYMPDVQNGFRDLPAATTPGNTKIPPSTHGIYFQNRLFVIDARDAVQYRDTIWVSDFGGVYSVLEGNGSWNSFKINVGSRDRLVAVYKFNETTLIAAKSGSVYVISNIWGTNAQIQANAVLDDITTEYGCVAPDSFVQVGADVWFLAHKRGIVSIRQTEQNKLQGVDVPVSRDIQGLIDRINWEHADLAVSAFADNLVRVAVPLDDSTVNNAVLVYDTTTGAWAGFDTGAAVQVRDWLKFTYAGAERLHFLSADGYLNMVDEGYLDHVADAEGNISYVSVASTFRTRGYRGSGPRRNRFRRASARVRTWWPTYQVDAILPGVEETRVVQAPVSRDRTRYYRPWNAAAYDPSNVNDDYLVPHRQDYSLEPPVGGVYVGVKGWVPNRHQERPHEWRLNESAEWLALEFKSTRGRLEVAEVAVNPTRQEERTGGEKG